MSRTKKQKTAKKRYQTSYLDVRRKRYATDEEYRKAILERERASYRAKCEAEGRPVREKDYGLYAGDAASWSSDYVSESTGRKFSGLNVKEMAPFLNMSETGLRAWIRTHRFPAPERAVRGGMCVYTVTQANALAYVLFNNLEGKSTLRKTDDEIINALWRAM